MAEVYDFETGFNFTSWAMQFDQFHDCVVLEIKVFADEDFQLTEQQYRAELVLVDPYERFDVKTIYIGFEIVEISSFKGLSSLSSELSGLVFERTPTGVRLASHSGNGFAQIPTSHLRFRRNSALTPLSLQPFY